MSKILLVDDEQSIRTMLADFFEERYTVSTASHAAEALRLLELEDFDLVISDINMPGVKGHQLLTEIKKRKPRTKTMLMTAYNVDDYMRMAKEHGISNIVPKTVPFNYDEIGALVEGLLTGNVFGLPRYLAPGATIAAEYTITSSEDSIAVREEVGAAVARMFGQPGDIKLIMDEIITNAMYHAPTGPDGRRKYRDYVPIKLDPAEYVKVSWGYDREKYGVSVLDNQGRLRKETVLHKIDRHVRGEGMLDDSGRGIHMSRLFADRMIINIKPGAITEIIILNYFSNPYSGYKPLYINEL